MVSSSSGKIFLLIKKSVILELLSSSISSLVNCIIVKSVSSMLSHSKFSIRSSRASSSWSKSSKLSSIGLSANSPSVSTFITVQLSDDVMVVVVVC